MPASCGSRFSGDPAAAGRFEVVAHSPLKRLPHEAGSQVTAGFGAKFGAKKTRQPAGFFLEVMAERTGLEPATSGVTGQHSNRLNYRSTLTFQLSNFPTSSSLTLSGGPESGVPTGIRTPVATVKG